MPTQFTKQPFNKTKTKPKLENEHIYMSMRWYESNTHQQTDWNKNKNKNKNCIVLVPLHYLNVCRQTKLYTQSLSLSVRKVWLESIPNFRFYAYIRPYTYTHIVIQKIVLFMQQFFFLNLNEEKTTNREKWNCYRYRNIFW